MATIPPAISGRIALALLLLAAWVTGGEAATQSVLLVHDAGRDPGPAERRLISSAVDLLCHFDVDVTVGPVQDYTSHSLAEYGTTVYLGLREGVNLPDAFLADCYDLDPTLCWIGANFDQLAGRYSLGRYGFDVGPTSPEPAPTGVIYQGMPYWRAELPLPRITCTRPDVCAVLATLRDDAEQRPYAVRSGHLWYFPEVMLDHARRGGTYLILANEMHEVLAQTHGDERLALLVVTPVTPETDAGGLSALMRHLNGARTPFAIEVAALAPRPMPGDPIRLSSKRGLIGVLRGAQREGASIVASLPAEGEHADGAARVSGSASPSLHADLEQAIGELARCGLYPVALAAPRDGHIGQEDPALARACSTLLERRLAVEGPYLPPAMPFLIEDDENGRRVMPDNLSPLVEGRGEVETLLEAARRQAAVPDPWVTVRIAPEAPRQSVTLLVTGLESMGYELVDLRTMTNTIQGDSLHVRTFGSERVLADVLPDGWDATVLGPEPGAMASFDHSDARQKEEAFVSPGAMLLAYPRGLKPKTVFALEGDPQQITERAVQRIARVVVLFAIGASAVLLLIYSLHVAQRRGARER
jgi:hypothetical protein